MQANAPQQNSGEAKYIHRNTRSMECSNEMNTPTNLFQAFLQGVNRAPKVEIVTSNYALRLEFGERQGDKIPGRIFLEMGQRHGTKVAGTFEATVKP